MKKEICKNCTFYAAYYTRSSCYYGRLSHGFCSKYVRPQIQSEICGEYKSNERKEKRRQERLLDALERKLVFVGEMAQIVKEVDKNNKGGF